MGLQLSKKAALSFVLILGMVNLFADTVYEGASSINGPFLGSLGAGAATIGIIAGLGEFFGYSLRVFSGYLADKSGRYWLVTFVGYAINLLAVPALALAGNWQVAGLLMIAERIGRAIRKPSVEAMLSYTTGTVGRGWAYGVNTALDQVGATVGPLLMVAVLTLGGSYQIGYAILLVPTVLALVTLGLAQRFFPHPSLLEIGPKAELKGFTTSYWLYMAGGACVAAGLVSFELISYHFAKAGTADTHLIPLFFSVAMATNAIASLIFGKLFDRLGNPIVVLAFFLSSLFAPLVFFGDFWMAMMGMVLWGIGFGAQDTLLKAIIAGILPQGKRNLAFGLFYAGYGAGWLIGSTTTGLLYSHSLVLLVAFSMAAQLISLPFFIVANRREAS